MSWANADAYLTGEVNRVARLMGYREAMFGEAIALHLLPLMTKVANEIERLRAEVEKRDQPRSD